MLVRYQKIVIQSGKCAKSAKTAKFSKSANQLHITAESAFNLSVNFTYFLRIILDLAVAAR